MFRIFASIRFALSIVYVFLYWDCVIVVSYYHHIYIVSSVLSPLMRFYRFIVYRFMMTDISLHDTFSLYLSFQLIYLRFYLIFQFCKKKLSMETAINKHILQSRLQMLCMSTGMYMYLMDAQCNCSITQDIYGISVQIQAVAIRYFLVLFIIFAKSNQRHYSKCNAAGEGSFGIGAWGNRINRNRNFNQENYNRNHKLKCRFSSVFCRVSSSKYVCVQQKAIGKGE